MFKLSCLRFILPAISFVRRFRQTAQEGHGLVSSLLRFYIVWKENHLEVEEFFKFKLYRKEITNRRMRTFLGWRKHIDALIALNPIQYRCLTENKLVFHRYASSAGLPIPLSIGLFSPLPMCCHGMPVASNYAGLRVLIKERGIHHLIAKPIEGTRGLSIIAFDYDPGSDTLIDPATGDVIGGDEIESALSSYSFRGIHSEGFIIQERLAPSRETERIISPYCPISFRIVTLLMRNNEVEIIAILGKAAVGRSMLDNYAQGNIIFLLDGSLKCTGAKQMISGNETAIERHPDTGFQFLGWKPPGVENAVGTAQAAAYAFPMNRCIGWDVVLGSNSSGKEQTYILEGNNPWSVVTQEVCDAGLWQGEFKRHVQLAKKHGDGQSPWF